MNAQRTVRLAHDLGGAQCGVSARGRQVDPVLVDGGEGPEGGYGHVTVNPVGTGQIQCRAVAIGRRHELQPLASAKLQGGSAHNMPGRIGIWVGCADIGPGHPGPQRHRAEQPPIGQGVVAEAKPHGQGHGNTHQQT